MTQQLNHDQLYALNLYTKAFYGNCFYDMVKKQEQQQQFLNSLKCGESYCGKLCDNTDNQRNCYAKCVVNGYCG